MTNITGVKFNRLMPVRTIKNIVNGKSEWLCNCDCGNTAVVLYSKLSSGHTKSCGCLKIENAIRNGNAVKQHDLYKIFRSNSLKTHYWIGFIMADGCFSQNTFILTMNIKDQSHLKKFSTYINTKINENINKNICTVRCRDVVYIPKIMKKYGFFNNKTYNPCDISKMPKEKNAIPLLIGLIDGDGHINKNKRIRINLHESWLEYLSALSTEVQQYFNNPYINIRVYKKKSSSSVSGFTATMDLSVYTSKIIKKFIIKHKIPVLERKWNLIDEHYITKKELLGPAQI